MTEQQKEELLKEAEERYPPGTVYVPAHVIVDESLTENHNVVTGVLPRIFETYIFLDSTIGARGWSHVIAKINTDGTVKWATIISSVKKEEQKPFKFNIGDAINPTIYGRASCVAELEASIVSYKLPKKNFKIIDRKYKDGHNWYLFTNSKNWFTEEGIELAEKNKTPSAEELIEEAKRRYPKGTRVKTIMLDGKYCDHEEIEGVLEMYQKGQISAKSMKGCVYSPEKGGIWAEIAKKEEKQEEEKEQEFPYKVGDWVYAPQLSNSYNVVSQIVRIEDYGQAKNYKIFVKTKNGGLDWFSKGHIKRMAYSYEIPINTSPIRLTTYNGMHIGSVLRAEDLNSWGEGVNLYYGSTERAWCTEKYTSFSKNRCIEKIEERGGVMAYLVSGTIDVWIRADGYREFCEQRIGVKTDKLEQWCVTNIDPYKQHEMSDTPLITIQKKERVNRVEDVSGYIQSPITIKKPKKSGIIYVYQ